MAEAAPDPARSRRFFDPRRDKPGEVLGGILALVIAFGMIGIFMPILGIVYWSEEKKDPKHQWVLVGGWLAGALWVVLAWVIFHYHLFGAGSDDSSYNDCLRNAHSTAEANLC